VDAYRAVVAAGDDGNTMHHTSAVVEAEEVRPIVGKVHIVDAGVEHPSYVVEAEPAEVPWVAAVVFGAWHTDVGVAEVP